MSDDLRDVRAAIDLQAVGARALGERLTAQLDFSRQLCALHADEAKAGGWAALIEQACRVASSAAAGGDLAAGLCEAERILQPIGAVAKTYTIYYAGHGHIDMNWMWSWPETVATTNDTFTTIGKLMDEFPQFRFSQSQASVYSILEEHNPELLARVAELVKEGRWEVTASHWVEGDKNIASAEALCRHVLYTRRYMKTLFGLEPEDVPIDWSPDTFGHAITVPTYLTRGAVKYLYLHRPGVHTTQKPVAFWWEAPDGSRVLVHNAMTRGYNCRVEPGNANSLLEAARQSGLRFDLIVYGVGDHGGGPTRRDLLAGADMATWPVFPEIRFSTTREYFERLEKEGAGLPVVRTELNTEFTGCYTTQTLIKRANRYAENRLVDAELASAIAWKALGREYPAAKFEAAWRDTLFSHFHDILPGSGVHDTRTYTHGLYQKTMATTGMIETQALRSLAAKIDTSSSAGREPAAAPGAFQADGMGGGVGNSSADGRMSAAEQGTGQGNRAFVVFNPTPGERTDTVDAMIWDNVPAGGMAKPLRERRFAFRSSEGEAQPAQTIRDGRYWGHGFLQVSFPVDVPSLGYRHYTLEESEDAGDVKPGAWHLSQEHHCSYAPTERGISGIENAHLRLVVDPNNGGIRSLVHKASGREMVCALGGASALEYAVERHHGMNAWSIDHTGPVEAPHVASLRPAMRGPYRASIDVGMTIHESAFTLSYELRQDDPRLYIHIGGTWFQRGTQQTGIPMLRWSLPLALDDARARYEIPFGAIDRAFNNGFELPALQWAQVDGSAGGAAAGCLLLNDSKHGHSLDGNVLRLTLIRASYDPDPLPEIGAHEVHLAVMPFDGEMSVAQATKAARDFNQALRVVGTDVHEGTLPASAEVLSVQPDNVILSAVKKAEDDNALVLRIHETEGKKTTARIELNAQILGTAREAVEIDLVERPAPSNTAKVEGNAVLVDVPAHGIASIRVGTVT
jgi:alpha-mannosidase